MSSLKKEDNDSTTAPANSDSRPSNQDFSALTKQMMNDPKALAMMQSRLDNMIGNSSGYYMMLPESMKKRVRALRKMQVEFFKLEAKYYDEVHEIEAKYNKLYQPLYNKRAEIINAHYEPTEEECDFPDLAKPDDSDVSDDEGDDKAGIKDGKDEKEPEKTIFPDDTPGIPEFWLTILKSNELTSQNIQDGDEEILKNLIDVKLKYLDDQMGYTLEFHFKPNDYFEETVLTKTYYLKVAIDEKDPLSFDGPEITKCTGCKINWKPNKNPTIKVLTKKQKHKTKGSVRTITEEIPTDSFFNFFEPPEIPDDETLLDDDTRSIIGADYEIAEMFRHQFIPRAVLFFTGEANLDEEDDFEDDDYDEDESSEEDEDMDDDEDDDDDGDGDDGNGEAEKVPKSGRRRRARDGRNPQECKQH